MNVRPFLFLALLCLPHLAAQEKPAPPSGGQGDLLVAPTRVILDGHKRTAEVMLSNTNSSKATYRVTVIRMEMDEEGGIQELPWPTPKPGELVPQSLIRFSPREVTLEGHETQTVRIQVRKPAELPTGEYRLHLLFRAVPPAADLKDEPKASETKGISVSLTTIYGLAIPVIVRQGETQAKVEFAKAALDLAKHQLHFQLMRTGNQSVYGNLKATLLPRKGEKEMIALMQGVSVYTPNPSRTLTLSVAAVPEDKFKGARIQLTYNQPDADGGALMAETFMDLP